MAFNSPAKPSGGKTLTTAQALGSLLKSARDIMRKDKGLNGDLDHLPLLTWIMFLKFLDDLELQREEEAALAGRRFRPAIEAPYRWRDWAADPQGLTGDELLAFLNQEQAWGPDGRVGAGLFAYLKKLTSANGDNRRDVIATVFRGVDNRMKSGYSRVTEFVRRWREQGGQALVKAFVPLQFELGEAFQFDWSEEKLVIGGVWRKVLASHLKLCASRAFVVQAYPTQGHEMLFDAHTRAFTALGGIPRRGIYDNMKTAVDRVKKGKGRTVNTRFAAMASHYLFDPDFCNVASGWEKGVVEKNVQDSRRRLWIDAAQERFGSFTELNIWLLTRCQALWQELRHPEFDDLTVAEMLEHEQPSLMPMVPAFDGYVETLGKVTSTGLVSLDRNRYSVPCELVGQMVSLRLYPERVDVVAHDTLVASHPRSFDRNQTRYDWQHYIPLIERKPGALRNGAPFADMPGPLLRLRGLVLKHEGGDRVMAKVLAAVPIYGLEAVLVAVELVLESNNPSAEHIENVLNRLKHAPMPAPIETALAVSEAPIADTERYDSLREVSHA